jgi:4-amino-4-deoxy-L-arabinose transferase-like glycosyltransferase
LTSFRLIVWMACTGVLLLATLVARSRGLWSPDELRYAQIVQRMDHVSDLFVLRLWDSIYTEKPPLFFWLVRGFVPLTGGVFLSTLLVPIVTASCLLLWLTGRIAWNWYGKTAGMVAVLVLGTLPLFLLLSSIGRMDMLLALFVTAGVFAFYRGYVEDSATFRLLAYVWMGIGLLAKGPFGVVFPLAIAATALTISGKWKRLWCRDSCYGLAVLLAVVACWLVPAVWFAGLDYLAALIGKQVFERAVSGLDHGEPAYFYLWVLPIILLPWVLFLFPALRTAWARWRERRDERDLWLLCWLSVPLLVMSVVREKLPVYLLPAMPPIAVLMGRHWSELFAAGQVSARFRYRMRCFFALASLFGLIALASSLVVTYAPTEPGAKSLGDFFKISQQDEISSLLLHGEILCFSGAILVLLAVVGWMSMRTTDQRGMKWAFGALASVAPCGQLFVVLAIMPKLDPGQSWRSVAEAIASVQDAGEPVVTYGLRPFAAYYTSKDITWFRKQNSLGEYVQRNSAIWCATREQELDEIKRYCVVDYDPERRYPSPSGPIILVHLRPLSVATGVVDKNEKDQRE